MNRPVHKNLTIFVLDVGAYSKQCTDCPGSKDIGSYLDKAKQIMMNMIKKMIFTAPNDEVALVCYGSSFNWDSIDTTQFQLPNWNLLKKIEELGSCELTGNFEEALTTALDTLKLRVIEKSDTEVIDSKRVCYFYNCFEKLENRSYNFDQVLRTKQPDFQMLCIGEKSWDTMLKEKELDPNYEKVIDFLQKISNKYLTMESMMEETKFVGPRLVKVIASNVDLSLSNIKIPISIYKIIDEEMRDQAPELSVSCDKTDNYLNSNKEVVDPSEVISAFKFGHTLIPVTEEDEKRMKHSVESKELRIMGFLNKNDVTFDQWGEAPARLVLPFKDRFPKHSSDYYSLHESMHRQNSVALVRGVLRTATEAPKVGLLYPEIDEKSFVKAFLFIEIPYEEQQYALLFKPIPESLEIERDVSESIRDFISNSMLQNPGEDKKYLAPGTVMNPALQLHWDSIACRILNKDKPLEELENSKLIDVFKRPQFVVDKSEESAQNLVKVFQKYLRTDEGVLNENQVKGEENQEKDENAELGIEQNEAMKVDDNEQYLDDADFSEIVDF